MREIPIDQIQVGTHVWVELFPHTHPGLVREFAVTRILKTKVVLGNIEGGSLELAIRNGLVCEKKTGSPWDVNRAHLYLSADDPRLVRARSRRKVDLLRRQLNDHVNAMRSQEASVGDADRLIVLANTYRVAVAEMEAAGSTDTPGP